MHIFLFLKACFFLFPDIFFIKSRKRNQFQRGNQNVIAIVKKVCFDQEICETLISTLLMNVPLLCIISILQK